MKTTPKKLSLNISTKNDCQFDNHLTWSKIVDFDYQLSTIALADSTPGRTTQRQQWEQLGRSLNINGPPTKTVAEWKRVWTLRKYSTKKKLTHNKNSIKQTGGGPFDLKPLDETEEAIVAACVMEASVSGIVGGFSFGSTKENSSEQLEIDAIDQLLDDLTNSPGRDRQQILQDTTSNKTSSTSKSPPSKAKTDYVLKKQLELQENFFSDQLKAQNRGNETLVEIRDAIRQHGDILNKKSQSQNLFKKEELEMRKLELEVAKIANELKRLELTRDKKLQD